MPLSHGTALLTIRAWCEEGSQHPLRAEIQLADDVASGFRSSVSTVHAEAIMEAVREFLDSVLCAGSHDPSTQEVLFASERSAGEHPVP